MITSREPAIRDLEESFFGGKGAAGLAEWIINQTPPHDTLIIPFAGHCALSRKILPCRRLILCDLNPSVAEWWMESNRLPSHAEFHQCCGVEFLRHHFGLSKISSPDMASSPAIDKNGDDGHGRTVVYADPPYMLETRTSDKRYDFELSIDQQTKLRCCLQSLPCPVMVSHYDCEPYNAEFCDWSRTEQQAMTRGGVRTEVLWRNFAAEELHDYRFFGEGFREREKLKRRETNLLNRLAAYPEAERRRLLQAIQLEYFNVETSESAAILSSLAETSDSAGSLAGKRGAEASLNCPGRHIAGL